MSETTDTTTTTTETAKTYTQEEFEKVLDRARSFEARATDYEKRFSGIDPDRAKAHAEEIAELRKSAAITDPVKLEELIKKTKEEVESIYSNKLTSLETAVNQKEVELNKLRVVNPAMTEATKFFHPTEIGLIQILVERDLAYLDGEVVVKGKDGQAKRSEIDPRVSMSLSEYMEGLTKIYPNIALPTVTNGSRGAGGVKDEAGKSGSTSLPANWDTLTQDDRRSFFEKNPHMIKQVLG